MNLVCINGNFVPAQQPVFLASNRGVAYGDGLFETIRVHNAQIPLEEKHFARLFSGMETLKIPRSTLTGSGLSNKILELCEANQCLSAARVRLTVFRSPEGEAHFLIQAVVLDDSYVRWPEAGWKMDVFPDARKSTDVFSSIKTANFLPYVLAGLYAKANALDE